MTQKRSDGSPALSAWADNAQREIDAKTKPPGALGRLEALAVRLATIKQSLRPSVDPARIVVFAADHGVAAEGVSAYPAEVTAQMMANFAAGGAAINVLAGSVGASVEVVDVGVDADLDALAGIVHAKCRRGSRNLLREPALDEVELHAALEVGADAVRRAASAGVETLGLGEMGIANTTAAAALLAALSGAPVERVTGRGTGVDDAGLARKRAVITQALARQGERCRTPWGALAAVGGLELAAIAGAVCEAPRHRMTVLVDGFISTVASLAAVRHLPAARANLVFAHCSAEAGHRLALDALASEPLLDLGLRLGEGTGAALALPLLRAAAVVLADMATFASAGVTDRPA